MFTTVRTDTKPIHVLLPISMASSNLRPFANRALKFFSYFHPDHPFHRFPDHYKRYLVEIIDGDHFRDPVNYIPEAKKWRIVERTGEIKRTQDYPIPVIFPKESGEGLWGGEGVVKGFRMSKSRYMGRVPHYWWPTLRKAVFYSEILDKYMSITCTERTLTLVDQAQGFDNYILKTTPCNLRSQLGMDLKRKMIETLIRREMYPDDPDKQQEIYEKYKQFIIPEDEAEWLGLSLTAAFRKQQEIDKIKEKCPPLKMQYRLQLINQLKDSQNDELKRKELESTRSRMGWLAKLNPFQKTESTPAN